MENIKIYVDKNNIKYETQKAILLQLTGTKDKVWIPKQFVEQGSNSYLFIVTLLKAFNYKISRYGNGQKNKHEVVHEYVLTADELSNYFEVIGEYDEN